MNKLGYAVNSDALAIIEKCEGWYKNEADEEFHKRKNLNNREVELSRLNFAKRCCADDANLCEIVSVAPEKESACVQFVEDFMKKNSFPNQYRKQLEKVSATGTVGAYIYLKNAEYVQLADGRVGVKGGEVRVNYVDAKNILPLTVEDDHVLECAFCGTKRVRGKEKTTLVIFTIENGQYQANTVVFDEFGKTIEEELAVLQLGEIKPFAIMRNAEVNNIENMEGYGLPKIYNAIPHLKALDLCYNILYGDLDKGDKLLFLNELLAEVQKKNDGSVALAPQLKDLFIFLGEKLPDEDSLIKEYNPEIRVDAITKAFELVLSLLSMSFGYGSKKYNFENGQIKTATEYIGEKQECMQELNKQRNVASEYIEDLLHAAMWFSNTFGGTSYNIDEALNIEFDDSYIEDKTAKLESMRADALSFGEIQIFKLWYIMEKYNIPEEEARKYMQYEEEPIDDVED